MFLFSCIKSLCCKISFIPTFSCLIVLLINKHIWSQLSSANIGDLVCSQSKKEGWNNIWNNFFSFNLTNSLCVWFYLYQAKIPEDAPEDASPTNTLQAFVHLGVFCLIYCSIWKDGAQGARIFLNVVYRYCVEKIILKCPLKANQIGLHVFAYGSLFWCSSVVFQGISYRSLGAVLAYMGLGSWWHRLQCLTSCSRARVERGNVCLVLNEAQSMKCISTETGQTNSHPL